MTIRPAKVIVVNQPAMHGEFHKARDALVRVSRLLQAWVREAGEQFDSQSVWHRCCEHLEQILAGTGPPKKVPVITFARGQPPFSG